MGHVTYEWVMSHMNTSCHIWMCHVIHEWVISDMNVSCHIQSWPTNSCVVTYECATSYMNEWYQIWMCHVTYSRVTYECEYEWVMSHMNVNLNRGMRHVTKESWYIWNWETHPRTHVSSHMNVNMYRGMRHVTKESWYIWNWETHPRTHVSVRTERLTHELTTMGYETCHVFNKVMSNMKLWDAPTNSCVCANCKTDERPCIDE